VEYKGTVEGLGVGTGSAFSLLPAQNATGNWIKVVQRVPVRVALDPAQVQKNPLRVGLSMDATVDVTNQGGKTLADSPRASAISQTPVFDQQDGKADEEVRRIIASNMGRPAASTAMAKAPAARPAALAPRMTAKAASAESGSH
jgi:membrane fusion protein (multidrug efflux system)